MGVSVQTVARYSFLLLVVSLPAVALAAPAPKVIVNGANVPNGGSITGTAPFSVHFDAVETDCDGDGRGGHEETEFQEDLVECIYSWDYGDPGSGNWDLTSQTSQLPRNQDQGFYGYHLFLEPGGPYDVVLSVTDANQRTAVHTVRVTVRDPDEVYRDSTWCFARGSGAVFHGCPNNTDNDASDCEIRPDQCVSNALATDVADAIASDRRILIRRGDSFPEGLSFGKGQKRVQVGAYPIAGYSMSSVPRVGTVQFGRGDGASEIALFNLDTENVNHTGQGPAEDVLLYRLTRTASGDGSDWIDWVGTGAGSHENGRRIANVELMAQGKARYQIWWEAQGWVLVGSSLMAPYKEALTRTGYLKRGRVSHNALGGPGDENMITIRSCNWAESCQGLWNEHIFIDRNFVSAQPSANNKDKVGTINVGNGGTLNGGHRWYVVERNYFYCETPKSGDCNGNIQNWEHDGPAVFRHNVYDWTKANRLGARAVNVKAGDVPAPGWKASVWFHNNCVYDGRAGSRTAGWRVVRGNSDAKDQLRVEDNLVYFHGEPDSFTWMECGGFASCSERDNFRARGTNPYSGISSGSASRGSGYGDITQFTISSNAGVPEGVGCDLAGAVPPPPSTPPPSLAAPVLLD